MITRSRWRNFSSLYSFDIVFIAKVINTPRRIITNFKTSSEFQDHVRLTTSSAGSRKDKKGIRVYKREIGSMSVTIEGPSFTHVTSCQLRTIKFL